ncbi:YlcI/YnfO family protein [Candidatus Poriferisodalis sp.]|uniref:YlcI/YnfO family protein n=1 Tax=Candidatus Poriferisodalis sp. TaxID=3101277 RepID=UPI003B02576B
MTRQTTVRLPDDLAQEAEIVARVQGASVNQLIVDSLRAEIDRVRADADFTAVARRVLERDRELLERLAQ